jgi:hypothetical protein
MSLSMGVSAPAGAIGLRLLKPTHRELTIPEIRRYGMPQRGLSPEVNAWRAANRPHLWRGLRKVLAARALKLPHMYGVLFLEVLRGDGRIVDLGLTSMRVVTTVGVKFICDDLNNSTTDCSLFKFHGFGTGTNAEAVGDAALQTELTTQYASDSTRPTGSQASATVSTNATYTTVATLSPDSGGTIAITEHGIFSATSAGTLLDRSVFSAVNLVAGSDSLQATYVYTLNAGS